MPDYPEGHLGCLTAEQQKSMDDFRALVVKEGFKEYEEATPEQDMKLLRFLRARRWAIDGAYKQFKDTEDWRSANQVDTLYETIDSEAYQKLRGLYPQWTGRYDKVGWPLYTCTMKNLSSRIINESEGFASQPNFSQAKFDGQTSLRFICFAALYENLLRFTQPLMTELPGRHHGQVPVTLSTYVFDVSGVSFRQFWDLKSHIHTLAYIASSYYPETLGHIFIVGAPSYFGTVFAWIKGWLDPVTASKIRIVDNGKELAALEDVVDKANIPKIYGGDFDFEFGHPPATDPTLNDALTWEGKHSSFPLEPLIWEPVEGTTKLGCYKVGTLNGEKQRELVCTIERAWLPSTEKKE